MRQIDIENYNLAQRLMSTKLNPVLSRNKLKITFEKHLKTKEILCKLPIIDLS